jgi:PAS domain S-box-containing protein
MPPIKKRIFASAFLLAIVLIFNILGYYYINVREKRNTKLGDGLILLSSMQGQSQEISQGIIVLTIHQSFSADKYKQQTRELEQITNDCKNDYNSLQHIIYNHIFPPDQPVINLRKLFSDADKSFKKIIDESEKILTDTGRKYLNNYSFTAEIRSNEASLRKQFLPIAQSLRNIDSEIRTEISHMNRAIIVSLFVALLFIALLLVAPAIKLNIKSQQQILQTLDEVKRSEAMLRTVIDSSPDLIFILDKNQKYKMVNKTLAEVMNQKPEEFLGKDDLELGLSSEMILGNISKGIKGLWNDNAEVIITKKIKFIAEETLHLNGKTRIVSMTKAPLINANGEVWGLLGFAHDMTNQIEAQNLLVEEKINHQKEIAKATIDVQEKERDQIGKELHDNVNQILTSAKLYLESMANGNTEKHRKTSIHLINSGIQEIRKLSKSFIPPRLSESNLINLIEDLLEDIYATQSIEVNFCHKGFSEEKISKGLKLTVYRIIQEQTTNIIKYAKASKIKIELFQHNDILSLNIQDNGNGFDTTIHRKGVGITNMMNRAEIYQGNLNIDSSPGKGCILTVNFKLESSKTIHSN